MTKPSGAKCMYIYIFVSVRQKSCSECRKMKEWGRGGEIEVAEEEEEDGGGKRMGVLHRS